MKRLLIVDDNPDHRLIVRTMLEAEGYKCEEADDGEGALSQLKKPDQVSLVLTDLNMSGMNGLELIAQMEKLALLQNIPAILMTSQSKEDLPLEAYTTGARAVISKVYEFSRLLYEVKRAIGPPETADWTRMP